MDEILYDGPKPESAAPNGWARRREALLDGAEQLRRRGQGLRFRLDAFLSRFRLNPVFFLVCALLIGGFATFSAVYTRGYVVTVDGRDMGIVSDTASVDAIVSRVERRASDILDRTYHLDADVVYTPKYVQRSELSSPNGLETYLFNQIGEVMKTYVLTVDGRDMGAVETRAQLDEMLDRIKAPYITENTIISEFTVPVHIDHTYTPTDSLRDTADIWSDLTANAVEEVTYTVEKGDTYIGIAYAHDMSLDELMKRNPEASLDSLFVGDVLTVQQSVPYLSVKTVDRVTYEEAIEPPVEYVDDDTMYQKESKVLDPGEAGLARVTARITSVNGIEDHRDITQSEVLSEPKTKVVAQGTKPRPKTMPNGYFIWPVRGTITSTFGYRSIFGTYSYHSGLDIAVPYGTTIKAADGGTVVWAGWKGSYGKLVIIDHGGGKKTYYGHNSSLLVSAGDKVYQGQAIAKAGSTGNSTGNHCHFEVRLGKTAVNPLSYL